MKSEVKVLLLTHPQLIPPVDKIIDAGELEHLPWKTEYSVYHGLRALNYQVTFLGVDDNLESIKEVCSDIAPDMAFNLMEQFDGETAWDKNLVAYLEMIKLPYTGCNPKGLMLGRDKSLSKKILNYHRIKTPLFLTAARGRKFTRPNYLKFPLIVKSLTEEGSTGISQNSVVTDDDRLQERIAFIHDSVMSDAIIESYIEGKDIYVSLMGNKNLTVFPVLELKFNNATPNMRQIATGRVKWNAEYRKKYGIDVEPVSDLPRSVVNKIIKMAKKIYSLLSFSGYARIDLRLNNENEIFFIEANPNPDIGENEEFALSAKAAGVSYPELLNKIMDLGWQREKGSRNIF